MRVPLVSVVSLLVALSVACPARGQAPDGRAAELKAQADALFDAGRFAEAYEGYGRAYGERADPTLLYNQARALEAMGEYPEALEKLEAFAREAPPDVRSKVPALEQLEAELRARITTVRVRTNASGARLFVRGKDEGVIEGAAREVRLRGGSAAVRVTADGYEPFSREILLPPGGSTEIDATLEPRSVAPPPESGAAARGGLLSRWWFWTAVGAVVVGGAITAVALTTEKEPETGNFSPGRISTPLEVRF